jgi:histone deacetylase 8
MGSSLISRIEILSIHHASPGFFPSTSLAGLPDSPPSDPFNLSIPLHAGASSKTLQRMWLLVESAKDIFQPDYTILQCGTDGLAEDPCGKFNYSLDGMAHCVSQVANASWPGAKLLLGGGGYNSPNTARAWAYFTAVAVVIPSLSYKNATNATFKLGKPLSPDVEIPDHNGFPLYGPSFTVLPIFYTP